MSQLGKHVLADQTANQSLRRQVGERGESAARRLEAAEIDRQQRLPLERAPAASLMTEVHDLDSGDASAL
jgi:hypothetical protein